MDYKLVVEYNGKDFFGMQRQSKLRTVAGEIETVLKTLLAEEINIKYCSRTDKGVSATHQVVSFNTLKQFNLDNFRYKLNRLLPDDIKVKTIEQKTNFVANKNILLKTYKYSLFVADAKFPLLSQNKSFCYQKLNYTKMKQALKYFKGKHDFSAFCASDCEKTNKIRTIKKIKMIKHTYNLDVKYCTIDFIITGNGFLQHMVRIIVGTIVDVGLKKIKPKQIEQIILSKNRNNAGQTMPADGLCLTHVKYKKSAN